MRASSRADPLCARPAREYPVPVPVGAALARVRISRRDGHRHPCLVVALVGICLLAGCSASAEAPSETTTETELALADLLAAKLPEDDDRGVAAVITDDGVEIAYHESDEDTLFEIGSITKVLVGELLADAMRRGEVELDDTLGTYLDLGDSPAASVTLLQVATHHSGLPDVLDYPPGVEPGTETVDELIAAASELTVTAGEPYRYSNLGSALLGHALAAAAGSHFTAVLEERVLKPAGMTSAIVPDTVDELPETFAGGLTAAGEPAEPWVGEAWAPASGVDATMGDLLALARAVLDGPLEDSLALEPTGAIGVNEREQLGYLWEIRPLGGRTITGHFGLTDGFTSVLQIDREDGTAVAMLLNRSEQIPRSVPQLFAVMEPH
jgi:CubicO group peptidase (beta-lactamase class C family)